MKIGIKERGKKMVIRDMTPEEQANEEKIIAEIEANKKIENDSQWSRDRERDYKNGDYIDALMKDALARKTDGQILHPDLDVSLTHWQGVKDATPKPDGAA